MARRVVVTGAGVVSPLGLGLSTFLDALAAGRSGIAPIATFEARSFPTWIAAEVPDFDPVRDLKWPSDAADRQSLFRDRKVGFALEAGRQALAAAFGDPHANPYPAAQRGLSLGVGLEILRMDDLVAAVGSEGQLDPERLARLLEGTSATERFRIPADIAPRALAALFDLAGKRLVNVSACVAGTQALGQAYRQLRRGQTGMVLAGGTDSMINPVAVAGFGLLAATSASSELGSRASRPFDRRRDGFVLGEGAALFVLEEREAARARGATILCEIVGYGASLDAFKITDPDEQGRGAQSCMRAALADARLAPSDIGYINAHGTSTKKNDSIEALAINAVFGPRGGGVPVSSTKSMIGHCISAAGALEFAASLLTFQRDLLGPTMNHEEPDPACDLDVVPNKARPARVDTFLSNSFGFGGQNTSLIARRHTGT